jgi:phosphatidylglycerophosphate synthase
VDFQKYSDRFIAATLLPFIPSAVTPNQVSWSRIISLPFIYILLATGNYAWGLVLFAIAALTDALDGAMARTRDQVTETGKVLDAVADRGLIALVAILLVPEFFGWALLVALACTEVLNAAMAYRSRKRVGKNPGANWAGKVKMIVQCVAFFVLFYAIAFPGKFELEVAEVLLVASLPFALLQSFLYPKR